MRETHIAMITFLMVLLAPSTVATAESPSKPQVTFEPDAIVAQVTPGAKTAWFGIVREPSGYGLRMSDHAKMETDTDGDGIVRYSLAGVGELDSMWLVVDMTSGDSAVEGPNEASQRRKSLPAAALHGRGNGVSAKVRSSHDVVKLWFVRPGIGAWHTTGEDGARTDDDGTPDGEVTALLASLHAVGDSPEPPDDFARGDVVVVVDPFTLTVSDTRIKE